MFDIATEWETGTFSQTSALTVAGSVVLAKAGQGGNPDAAVTWWDASWASRQCFTATVEPGTTVAIRPTVDRTVLSAESLRAIALNRRL